MKLSIESMHLCTFAIILVFTSEALILEPVKHFTDSFGRLGEHGLQRYTWREFAVFSQPIDTEFK
jgi:hypothetical protein